MTWVKGQSGNPQGRKPKVQMVAELLRAQGDVLYPGSDVTYRERAARVVWEQACKGHLPALQWITERTDGKVVDRVEQTGTSDVTVRFVPAEPRTEERGGDGSHAQ